MFALPVFVVHVATGYTLTAGFDGSTFCRQLKSAFTSQSPWFGKHLLYCRGLKGLNYDPTVLAEIHLDAEHFGYTKLIPAGCLPKLQSRVTAILRGAANELGQDWKHLTVKAFPQDEPMTKVTNKQLPEGTINPICFTVGEKADLVTRITGHILPDVGLHAELQLPDPENGHKMFKHILDEEFHHTAKGDSPYRTTELLSYNKTDGSFVYQMAYPCSSDPNDCIQPLKVMIKSSEILAADNTESFDKVCRVWSNDIDELVVYLTVSKEETTVGYDAVESLKKRLRRSRVLHSTISAQFDDTSPLSPSKPQAVRLAFDYFMLSELAGSINFENVKTFAENKLAGGEFQQLNDSYKFTLQGMNLDTVTLDCGAPIADDPSAPQNLRVVKVTKHGVKLSWEAPADDGGSPITQYVIRFWPADASTPQQVGRTAELEAFVDQVVQGSSGGFDVGAVNVGQTPVSWSGRTDTMTVSEPAVEPRIFRPVDALNPEDEGVGGLKSVTLKSGENLRLAAAWFGNPIPQVVWRRDNVEIRESDGYSFLREEAPIAADLGRFEQREQPESGTAVLAFSGVTRRNRGRYELVLTNSVGTVTSECDVEVIDVPGISGELSAKVTAPTSVQLEWNAPGDDGGRAIEVYVVEKRLEGNAEWELVELVDSRRRSVTDTDLQPGKKYEFRVAARNSLGVGQAVYTNEPVLVRFEDSTVCLANSPGPSVISLASTKYIGDDGRELFLDCACADEDVIDEVESYLQTPPRET
ncbi:Titin [Clonorchis sinensis]|uniref:Titin n=1 Tax=Clonorchis sinensis TaxID=79923 RepID=A0A8T1MVC8_CLOSI|nr:Titin [Clonorchis sinensis]